MADRRRPAYNVSLDTALKQGGFYGADGVWNSLIKFDGRILRGRVETLIFKKEQQQVYMRLKSYNKKQYRIPGGSFEKDVPNYIQAQNEINEEARLKVKNLVNSGQHYMSIYKSQPKWMDNADIDQRLRWTGTYTEVYVAEYDGPFIGEVSEEDKDDDMYINGKFYNLYEVYSILSETHRKIIDEIFPNIEKGAISESMIVLKESTNKIHYYPYYTPGEMSKLGVFNESKNRYSDIEDEAIEWYLEYTDSLHNPDSENWMRELKDRYSEYTENATLENKQLILNLGWNPEVPVTVENVIKASKRTKDRINKRDNNIITIDENMIFSKKDMVYNIDDFESGKSNILLVTGMSGSGKSTLSYELSDQYNAEIISLDYFQCYDNINRKSSMSYIESMSKDDLSYKLVDEYMGKNKKVKESMHEFSHIDLVKFKEYFVPYFEWLMNKLSKMNGKYIVEGVHIMLFIPYKQASKYPLYCINTSTIKSLTRHWVRDGWTIKDIVKYGYEDILLFNSWDKSYEKFKAAANESTVYDPFSGEHIQSSITYDDFVCTANVVQQMINNRHKIGELLFVNNRDVETDDGKWNFAEYHISDKNDSESLITFIDMANGQLESSVYPGKIEIPENIKKFGILNIVDELGLLG